jgi:conjugative relaxase-like TrwC/TraI family protein
MLSIGKLNPSRAGYYAAQLPGGQDEYYTGGTGREAPAVWMGSAAANLGLVGAVGPEQFRRVLDAHHPDTGQPFGVPGTTAKRLAGYDLCFSAPKSVSVAWALAPPEISEQIAAAHDRAVVQCIGAFETEVVRARRGRRGGKLIATDGVAAAAFAHRTSRRGDPQIHTHVVVPNLTVDDSGRWSALAGDRVYRWAKTLGYLYQSALRAELSQTLGVRWGPVHKGAAEIEGIDARLRELFSKRRADILNALEHVGGRSRAAAQTAALDTRPAKDQVGDLDSLRQHWLDEAMQTGVDLNHINMLDPRSPTPAPTTDIAELTADLLGSGGLTADATSFDRRDVLQAISAAHTQGIPVNTVRAGADCLLGHPQVIPLVSDRPAGPRYSTAELIEIETNLVDTSRRRADARLGIVAPPELQRSLDERPTLTDEQEAMVASLVTSGSGVEVVVGRAGAGKTFALDAARSAWEASGLYVIGAALAARAAAELQAGAGIASTTLDRLLADLDRPGPLSPLPHGSVVVVDEAAMVGTRKLARLLDHARQQQTKVVLVGDHRQLPEINAGGAFAALTAVVPTSELSGNRRQIQQWERAALGELRAGSVPAAIDAYRRAGRITLAPSAETAREQLVADWWNAYRQGQDAGMYALHRSDVEDLNRRARHVLDQAGHLGQDRLNGAGREFAVGDRIQCLRNDRRLQVRNGTTATIIEIHADSGEISLDSGVRLTSAYLADGHVDHGYCTTIHKAQGATVERAFLLGSEALYREAGYVGLSRARQATQLYIVAPALQPHADLDNHVDPVVGTIRRLSQSRAQTLALQQTTRAPQLPRAQENAERQRLLADPPPWLTDALGPPPIAGRERDGWADTAERIAAYRHIYDIDHLANALGPRPEQPEQQRAWDLAQLGIAQQQQQNIELDQGLQL